MWLQVPRLFEPPVRSIARALPLPLYIRKFQPVVGERWKKTQPDRFPGVTRLNKGQGPGTSVTLTPGLAQYSIVKGLAAGGFSAALYGTKVCFVPPTSL